MIMFKKNLLRGAQKGLVEENSFYLMKNNLNTYIQLSFYYSSEKNDKIKKLTINCPVHLNNLIVIMLLKQKTNSPLSI